MKALTDYPRGFRDGLTAAVTLLQSEADVLSARIDRLESVNVNDDHLADIMQLWERRSVVLTLIKQLKAVAELPA